MGMPISIDLRDEHVADAVIDRAFDWFRWVDATFSTYRPDSEMSRLNAGELPLSEARPEVQIVLERCEELRLQTDGYFDIRTDRLPLPLTTQSGERTTRGIDPSGLVKGWSVDRAAELLDDAGARNYCIAAGGDIRVRGRPAPAWCWRLGIQHPYLRDKVTTVLMANDLAVATSGAYERGEHILDPHTGNPPAGVLSVTVIGPELATADGYATAIFAMGAAGPNWSTRLVGYEAMTILADETVLMTPGFPWT